MRKRAFTLIELLAVIAIITILAAILYPVGSRPREAARKSNCLSNLAQLGKGMKMYAQDYDEILPHAFFGTCGTPTAASWADVLVPYVRDVKVYDCPSSTTRMTFNSTTNTFYRAIGGSPNNPNDCRTNAAIPGGTAADYNYGVNNFGLPVGQTDPLLVGPFSNNILGLAAIPAPAGVVGIADSRFSSPAAISGGSGPWDLPSVAGQVHAMRHSGVTAGADPNGGLNAAFMDGHAKWISLGQSVRRPGNIWTCSEAD